MKQLYKIISLVIIIITLAQCKSDEKPNLGTVKIDGVATSIHSAKLVSTVATHSTSSNIHAFHFYTKENDTEREIKIVVSYPYNYTGIDGNYEILANTRQMSIADSFYFVRNGNNTNMYSNLTIGQCTIQNIGDQKYKVTFSMQPQNGPMIQGEFNGRVNIE